MAQLVKVPSIKLDDRSFTYGMKKTQMRVNKVVDFFGVQLGHWKKDEGREDTEVWKSIVDRSYQAYWLLKMLSTGKCQKCSPCLSSYCTQ